MRIRRTKKIDRRGLIKMSRKFGIAKMFSDNLIRGNVVELPDDKADALISHGYAVNAGGRAVVDNTTVDDRDITTTETVDEVDEVDEKDIDDEDYDDDVPTGDEAHILPDNKDITLDEKD